MGAIRELDATTKIEKKGESGEAGGYATEN